MSQRTNRGKISFVEQALKFNRARWTRVCGRAQLILVLLPPRKGKHHTKPDYSKGSRGILYIVHNHRLSGALCGECDPLRCPKAQHGTPSCCPFPSGYGKKTSPNHLELPGPNSQRPGADPRASSCCWMRSHDRLMRGKSGRSSFTIRTKSSRSWSRTGRMRKRCGHSVRTTKHRK